jgi:hypothetical protein
MKYYNKYTELMNGGVLNNNIDKCSICFEELHNTNKNPIIKLICNHKFHFDCIKQWISNENSCPICRGVGEIHNNNYIQYQRHLVNNDESNTNRSNSVAINDDTLSIYTYNSNKQAIKMVNDIEYLNSNSDNTPDTMKKISDIMSKYIKNRFEYIKIGKLDNFSFHNKANSLIVDFNKQVLFEFLKKLLKRDGLFINLINKYTILKIEHELLYILALYAVKQNGLALEHLNHLNNDEILVNYAITQNGLSLQYASESLRMRKDFFINALTHTNIEDIEILIYNFEKFYPIKDDEWNEEPFVSIFKKFLKNNNNNRNNRNNTSNSSNSSNNSNSNNNSN